MFTIYKITRNDGLEYVGQTINLKTRLYNHRRSKKFRDFGILKVEVIDTVSESSEADKLESLYIEKYDTFNNGLNMTYNGRGNHKYQGKFSTLGLKHSDETKAKIANKSSIRMKEYWRAGVKAASQEAQERAKARMTETRRKQGCTHTKFTEDDVREVLNLYSTRPYIEGIGEKLPNGHVKTYDRAFANKYAEQFSMTPAHIRNLVQRKNKYWNHLYEEILDLKS